MVGIFALTVAYLTWIIFHTQIKRTLDFQKKELEFVKKQLEMGNETVLTIARTVDAKDVNTSQHSLRVSEYSVMIAKELGYSDEECENLRKAALLHDIGKIGIPDRILNKPERLTDEEYAIMKSHVEKGAEILKSFTLVNHVEEGALYHHERYDGKGYMHGLKGEEIPLAIPLTCVKPCPLAKSLDLNIWKLFVAMPTGELKSEMYCTEYFIFSLVSVDLSSIIILSLSIPLSHRYSYIASASVLFSPRPCPPDTIILHSVLIHA